MHPPRLLSIAGALACAATASAAVTAGAPLPPAPGALPEAWLTIGNDDINRLGKPSIDDHRTNQTVIGMRFGDALVAVLDHSIITDRRSQLRCDEATITLGWLPFGDGAGDTPRVAVGGGARWSGDLLGDELQNGCHVAQGFDCYPLRYEPARLTAVAYVDGVWPWFPFPWGGFEGFATGVATSYVELQADLGVRAVLRTGDEARLWLGARQRAHDGDAQSASARAAADHERGTWVDFGGSWRMWALGGGVNTGDGSTFGMVSMTVKSW